ncbi:hypothetical protein BGU93_19345, partial [Clostridioides difficile]
MGEGRWLSRPRRGHGEAHRHKQRHTEACRAEADRQRQIGANMKIEIRKTEVITPDLADTDYCEVYLTRKQFMREYEADKYECVPDMQHEAAQNT